MNIFYIDPCPVKAAQMQCDKHVVKMVLESAQMLCAAHHVEGDGNVPYKLAHKNHPSTVWVRSNRKHYDWLYRHFKGLSEEYTDRYGKVHLTWEKCREPLRHPPTALSSPELGWKDHTPPPQCMPDECKRETSLAGYTEYYFNYKPKVIDMRFRGVKYE